MKKVLLALFAFGFLPLAAQGGDVAIDEGTQVLFEPGNIVLQHALLDYHHYYPRTWDLKCFDFYINPFFTSLRVKDGVRKVDWLGAFIQGQVNLGDFWIRANTLFGKVKEEVRSSKEDERAFDINDLWSNGKNGIDDVLLKLGYDFFFNYDDHFGLYVLGGLPTQRSLKGILTIDQKDDVESGCLRLCESPVWGTKNFRIGAGFNTAVTLFDENEAHLAFLMDAQYRFAFPATFATSASINKHNEAPAADGVQNGDVLLVPVNFRFTPGHTVNGWGALHYSTGYGNIELGGMALTTFGEQQEFLNTHYDEAAAESPEDPNVKVEPVVFGTCIGVPATVKLMVQPYLAISYNGFLYECPTLFGLGASYNFNKVRDVPDTRDVLHGFTVWGSVGIAF